MNKLISLLRTIVGPTAVIAAGTMGAGAVASFLLAGAWFHYDLLWVILLMLPMVRIPESLCLVALEAERSLMCK